MPFLTDIFVDIYDEVNLKKYVVTARKRKQRVKNGFYFFLPIKFFCGFRDY